MRPLAPFSNLWPQGDSSGTSRLITNIATRETPRSCARGPRGDPPPGATPAAYSVDFGPYQIEPLDLIPKLTGDHPISSRTPSSLLDALEHSVESFDFTVLIHIRQCDSRASWTTGADAIVNHSRTTAVFFFSGEDSDCSERDE
ncbi:uncharacterized protein LOC125555844 [Triticum urartu]|nr:uncharacterized protein LOC125555844 [Triticum urartu]